MPELPEIETIKNQLTSLRGLIIKDVTFKGETLTRPVSPTKVKTLIMDQKITRIGRQGKYLLITLSNYQVIVFHLRMTGQILYGNNNDFKANNNHLLLTINLNNKKELRFYDFRKFGTMLVIDENDLQDYLDERIGVDCLSPSFTKEYFHKSLTNRKQVIKSFLLNQKNFSGIGNIYADEALHAARISPLREAGSLTKDEAYKLHNEIVKVLRKGVKYGGSSVSDYYHADGTKGTMQNYLKAYSHGGEPCDKCGTIMSKIKVGGRGTVYCSHCQI